ncbi:anti-sigma factor [soil metagenome]
MTVHELLPLYVIDTLPDDERGTFDAHLDTCTDCQVELASYGPVLEALADEVAVTPDAGMRDRVLAQIADVAQDEPVASDAGDAVGAEETDGAATVVPFASRPRREPGPSRWLALAAAVLAFAFVAATTTGVALWRQTNRLEEQLDVAAQQQTQATQLAAVLAADDARLIAVETDLSGNLRVAVADSAGTGAVVADQLELPPDDRVYQLWLVGEGDPRSAGVVARDQRDGVVGVLSDIGDAKAVAISVEPPSGSNAPTGPIVGEAPLN